MKFRLIKASPHFVPGEKLVLLLPFILVIKSTNSGIILSLNLALPFLSYVSLNSLASFVGCKS